MVVNRAIIVKYATTSISIILVLIGARYFYLYLFSVSIDWNIAIAVLAILIPIAYDRLQLLWKNQKENQLKIEEIQEALTRIPGLEAELEKANLLKLDIVALRSRTEGIVEENRRQERSIARLEAVQETIVRQEQLHAKVDRLSDPIAKLQKSGSNNNID